MHVLMMKTQFRWRPVLCVGEQQLSLLRERVFEEDCFTCHRMKSREWEPNKKGDAGTHM